MPGEDEEDLELGEGGLPADDGHEEGITSVAENPRATTLEEEVSNWDENAVDDWDEDDGDGDIGVSSKPKAAEQNGGELADAKKRAD